MTGFFENRNYPAIGFGPSYIATEDVADETNAELPHYTHVGKTLIKWAQNRTTWPNDIVEFLRELKAHHEDYNPIGNPADRCIVFPRKIKRITIVQAGDGSTGAGGQPIQPNLDGATVQYTQDSDCKKVELDGDDGSNGPEFVVRLPPCGQVTESEDRILGGSSYLLPPLYEGILFSTDPNPGVNSIDVLRARVADYTMRSCR